MLIISRYTSFVSCLLKQYDFFNKGRNFKNLSKGILWKRLFIGKEPNGARLFVKKSNYNADLF